MIFGMEIKNKLTTEEIKAIKEHKKTLLKKVLDGKTIKK